MKILYSPASPFVRKCLVAAHELGLDDRIERVPVTAHPVNRDPSIVALNPLGKVPTLLTDDGAVLYDSRVICEYLNAQGDGHLIPSRAPERWQVLTAQSLADGIMDAAVLTRYETAVRPRSAALERMEHRPAREGDRGTRAFRTARGAIRRPRRRRNRRVRLRAGLPRFPLRASRVARPASQCRRLVPVVRRARFDGRDPAAPRLIGSADASRRPLPS